MVDHKTYYRESYENMEVICEIDDCRAVSHWTEERVYWHAELRRWQKFKETQRVYNESGRTELDLELENTDVALVGALSQLNDWKEFQSVHQKKVHQAEIFHEECQKEMTIFHNTVITITNFKRLQKFQEKCGTLMARMMEGQKQLEASRKELMWIKSQWKEVIAEACASIAEAPQLQQQLEDKFKMQTEAVYRRLIQKVARPSHARHPPDMNTEFPQRIQHWFSEGLRLEAELWDWKHFRAWRQKKGAQTTHQEAPKQPFIDETCSEIFEELVKFRQHELDEVDGWVNGWRRQAKQYKEEKEKMRVDKTVYPPFLEAKNHDESGDEDADVGEETLESKMANFFTKEAEEMAAAAATRLEQSKQKFQEILAESASQRTAEIPAQIPDAQHQPAVEIPAQIPGARHQPAVEIPAEIPDARHQPAVEIPAETPDAQQGSTAKIPAETPNAQPPPTPPKTPSPKLLPKNRSPPKKKHPTEKAHRRSKKKKARSLAPKPNTNTTLLIQTACNTTATNQHPLPAFSPSEPPHPNKDADTEMSDEEAQGTSAIQALVDEEVNQTDAVMSDIGDPSPPPSPSQPNPQTPPSRTLRSATRAKHAPPPRKILKESKVLKNTPPPPQRRQKSRTFTEAQTAALLDAASNNAYSSGGATALRRSERLKGKGVAAGADVKAR